MQNMNALAGIVAPQGGGYGGNALVSPVQAPAQAGQPNPDDMQRQEAMRMRQTMQQLMGARPSPQTQSALKAIMQTMGSNPYMQTDDFMYGMEMLSKRHGVPLPFQGD